MYKKTKVYTSPDLENSKTCDNELDFSSYTIYHKKLKGLIKIPN